MTAVAVTTGAALFVVTAGATVTGSPSGFESNDGNMVLNTLDGHHTDWDCFEGQPGFQPGTPNSNCAVTTGAKDVKADAAGEVQLVNGTKFDTQCPGLNLGSNPPKDEFQYVASFSDSNPTTLDTYFYGATIRQTTNGNSSGNVEFNQIAGNGTTTHGCRSSGDRLLAYDFLNGGTSLTFQVLTWISSSTDTAGGNNTAGTTGCYVKSDSPPCWGAKIITPDSSLFEGAVNTTNTISAADNGISGQTLQPFYFAEFGVNLSQALGLNGKCLSFPQQVWESRSSGSSFTSNPQDIETENQRISNCGSITIIKHTDPRGINQSFSYSTTGGLTPSSFSLNDNGNVNSDNNANTQSYTNVQAGTYTVTEGSEPGGFALESLKCTGGTTSTSGATATITLHPNDQVVCTYTNQALGEIKIIKHTDPRGVDQVFSYTSNLPSSSGAGGVSTSPCSGAGVDSSGNFCLNDNGNSTTDNTANTVDETDLPVGSYTVNESMPTGWSLENLACTADASSGSSGAQDGTTNTQADITLKAGGVVTCTYQNKAPSGAILITKTGKDKACVSSSTQISNGVCTGAGTADLSGATFKVTTDQAGNNPASGSPATTGAQGTACIDGLFWNGSGNTYYVSETSPPTGYSEDPSNTDPTQVQVIQNAKCSDTNIAAEAATASFNDKPLTTLTVTASAVVPGATNTKITCATDDSTFSNMIGNSPVGYTDPATVKADGSHGGALTPGTYYCKIDIDP